MREKKNLPQKRKSCLDSQSTSNSNNSKEKKETINPNKIGQNVLDEAKQTNKENKKYILNQNISKDITIEEFDPKTNIPLTIIYDNHKYILFTKNPMEHKKNTYKCCLWRRIRNKTSSMPSFCNSTITSKIENDNKVYYIGLPHSYDCNNIYNISEYEENTVAS